MAHWWENYPWRMIQTNLRQIDMEDMSAQRFAEDLKRFDANVVLLNTGGIIASYQTGVEDHFQSEYLHGDSLQKVMQACRDAGIRVIARMDFSKVRRPIYEKHPDWAYRTIDGDIVDYNGDVHACVCGGYQQGKAFEIVREVAENLPIDGLFCNMGGFQVRDYSYNYHGICHCDNCKRRFRERFGLELPAAEDMDDPVFRKYKIFQQEVLADYKQKLTALIKGINPEIAVDGVDFTRMESNTEYRRPLPFWQYSAASNTRALRGLDGSMVSSNTSVDFIGFCYRHVAVNPEEQELRLWQDVANFGGIDYYLIGRLDNHEDQSGYEGVQRVFHYMKAHEREYQGIAARADALLLRGYRWDFRGEEQGWIRALTESHVLFDEVHVTDLRPEDSFDKYRLVIMPDTTSLPAWLAEKLDAFAQAGGCVIASGNTGRYDGNLDVNEAYPLKCMGIRRILMRREDMISAMLHVEDRDLQVLDSFGNDRVIYFGEDFLFAEYEDTSTGYLRLIPPHHMGPPERCYYTQITDIPGLQVNAYGAGKGILIPWAPGRLYSRDGYANTFRFMRDVLKNIVGLKSVAAQSFTQMVEVAVGDARDGSRTLIQLVNNTGHFGTSYLAPVPVRDIALRIPLKKAPAAVVSQTTGEAVPFEYVQSALSVTVDVPGFFEGLRVDY